MGWPWSIWLRFEESPQNGASSLQSNSSTCSRSVNCPSRPRESSSTVKHRLPPPKYLNLVIGFQVVLHFVVPIRRVIWWPYSSLGLVLIALGAIINMWAVRLLLEKNTTLEFHGMASVLVTDGPYRLSRNPVYLGSIFVCLGLAILLGSLTAIVFPAALFWILNALYVPPEETALQTRFGGPYLDYKRKVRKWL